MLYKLLILPILQLINPEVSHFLAEKLLQLPFFSHLNPINYSKKNKITQTNIAGLELDSPIGLAAGYDKNCKTLKPLLSLGFGFVTGGTITLQERFGNPKPRLFHIPEKYALVNSLGFPSIGLDNVEKNLRKSKGIKKSLFLSVSGVTEDEIISCVERLEEYTNIFEINVSSPNTSGLRVFHNPSALSKLVEKIKNISSNKILIKLPPWEDKEKDEYLALARTSIISGADGLVIANSKPIMNNKLAVGKGGISGKVLIKNTQRMIAEIRSALGSDPIIIACGGIFDEKDVWNCLALGADLCQAYTGFIYNGPFFAHLINKNLAKLMKEKNVSSLEEIKGLSLV